MALPAQAPSTESYFSRQFDIVPADADALRERVFDLRFRVFCEELGFAMTHRDGQESDTYDDNSLHCLISHRATQADIGCVRVVLPRTEGSGYRLPFEKFGLPFVDRKLLDWRKLDPGRCCELSRLAVLNEFRRPLAVASTADGVARAPRRVPPVVLALYQATIALTLHHQFDYVFMVGEPRLQRHVSIFGINMRQVSPTFEYFGQRAVFVTTMADTLATIDAWSEDIKQQYDFVHQRLLGASPPALESSRIA